MIYKGEQPYYTKEQLNSTGIYAIVNNVNGKIYVGSALQTFRIRWRTHKRHLVRNIHDNRHLQRAWYKYGRNSFIFIILEICPKIKSICEIRETHYISLYNSANEDYGYNICKFGTSSLGVKRSEETRKKLSEISKANIVKMEQCRKLGQTYWKGRQRDPEVQAKMLETRKKTGVTNKQRIFLQRLHESNKGKKRTEESRKKISDALKGKKASDESRRKMSESHKGKKLNEAQLKHLRGNKYRRGKYRSKKIVEVNYVCELYKLGFSADKIGKVCSISAHTVLVILRRNNIPIRKMGTNQYNRPKVV